MVGVDFPIIPYFGADGSPYLPNSGGSDVVKIVGGWYHNIFLKEDGELWYMAGWS